MKQLLFTFTLLFTLSSFAQVPNYVPANGLEVYYSFSGNANEEINSLNGVVNGPVLTSDYNGNTSSAYSFNGISDYIAVPFQFLNGSENVSTSSYRVRFMCNTIGSQEQGIWNKDGSWREMRIRVHQDSSISLTWAFPNYYDGIVSLSGKIVPGSWYDVVFIISNNQSKIFINGVEETNYAETVSNSSVSFAHTGSSCISGGIECNRFGLVRWGGSPSRYFNGSLDEFGIWNRELSACEINSMYSESNQSNTSSSQLSECLSYTWDADGQTYTQSGQYITVLTNAQGCDSTVTLDLTITQPNTGSETVTECDSYTWIADGQTYTQSGQYTSVLTNQSGCDSTVTLDLTITNSNSSSETITECDAYTWNADGQTYTQSGQYTSVLTNQVGCDSTVTLNLTINNSNTGSETVTECDTYTWSNNGQTYTQSGQYTAVLTNAAGCDSTVTLDLTINNADNGINQLDDITLEATASNAQYQWVDCIENYQAISGATDQTFEAMVNGDYACIVTENGCSDTTACITISKVGISDLRNDGISVYPNPASSTLTIESQEALNTSYRMIDAQGREVLQGKLQGTITAIDIENLAQGSYTLLFNQTELKIIKE